MPTGQPIDIVLVHGTFAREADWIKPGSALCQTVSTELPNAHLYPFEWSGHNAHSARIAAGRSLSEFLQKLIKDSPERACFVIAHSHGGNALLYALSDKTTAESLSGCVFLGTPFLNARRRELKDYIGTLAFQLTWLMVYIPLMLLLILWLGIENGLLASVAVVFFAIPIASHPVVGRVVTERIERALLRALLNRQDEFAAYVEPAPLGTPALVCYVRRDEAQRWLTMLSRISRAGFVANDYVLALVSAWPVLMITIMLGLGFDWLVGEKRALVVRGQLLSFDLLMSSLLVVVAMSFVLPLVSIISRAHAAGFGWEGLLGYSLVDLYTTAEPLSGPAAEVTLHESRGDRPTRGLRHSGLYLDPDVIKSVVGWIRDQSTERVRRVSAPAKVWPVPQAATRKSDVTLTRGAALILIFQLLGISWQLWSMFHHFQDFTIEPKTGQIVNRQDLSLRSKSGSQGSNLEDSLHYRVLNPNEHVAWQFGLERPPEGQVCYLTGDYETDSAEGHVFVALEADVPDSGKSHWTCGFPHRLIYSGGLGRREASFTRTAEFGASDTLRGCTGISNYGKKTEATVGLNLRWECYLK